MSKRPDAFSYTENRERTQTQHRLWIGTLSDPADCLGFIAGAQYRDRYEASDVALPLTSLPHLIRFLTQIAAAHGIDLTDAEGK